MAIHPNTFLIGVQKAGTTSLNYWLSQHPQIFGSVSLKDVEFFLNSKRASEMLDLLSEEYKTLHQNPDAQSEKIILLSSVNYCYYPQALQKISESYPEAKLIIVLRNPVQRALSAYRFSHKLLIEKKSITEAFDYDWKVTGDKLVFSKDNNNFTYIEHGLYSFQLENIFRFFRKDQLHVVDFEEMEKTPQKALESIYKFLEVDENFTPDFQKKNVTGKGRMRFVNKIIKSKHPAKKWLVRMFIKPWLSFSKRRSFVSKVEHLNTSKQKNTNHISPEEKIVIEKLKTIYCEDAKKIDILLNSSFSEKWKLN